MAQTVQLFGTIVHRPKLIVLDEPFSGLDAINQGRLEHLIRDEAAGGATIIFSTHVIAHAERLCERIAIIAAGKVRFEGSVSEARDRLRPLVRLRTRASDGAWRSALPAGTERHSGLWHFELPDGGVEPMLKALLDGGAGIDQRLEQRFDPDRGKLERPEAVLVMGALRESGPPRALGDPGPKPDLRPEPVAGLGDAALEPDLAAGVDRDPLAQALGRGDDVGREDDRRPRRRLVSDQVLETALIDRVEA